MTLLVGMVGRDGIVFAADELQMSEAPHGTEYDDRVFIQKLRHSHDHRVVLAGVGDHITRRVEEAFLSALDLQGFDFKNVQRSLATTTKGALNDIRVKAEIEYPDEEERRVILDEHLPRALLIVFYGSQLPEKQLWSVFISGVPAVVQITGCRVNGGLGNLGRFFASYYQPGKSVASLKHLAAHTVLAANRFDSRMIDGLQVAIIDDTGFRLLSEEEKTELHKGYEEVDRVLKERLLPD